VELLGNQSVTVAELEAGLGHRRGFWGLRGKREERGGLAPKPKNQTSPMGLDVVDMAN